MSQDAEAVGSRAAAFVAFAGTTRIAAGPLAEVALEAKRALERDGSLGVLAFDADTGEVVDLDLRGTEADISARYASPRDVSSKRGRPKLGVVAREVTLLPRHWEWLARQPGGASVALRKLVEAARKTDSEGDAARARVEGAYRFISAMAGDFPGFEDAARSLFASDWDRLRLCIKDWPTDIRDQALHYLLIGSEVTTPSRPEEEIGDAV
jgi:hypothetical protein